MKYHLLTFFSLFIMCLSAQDKFLQKHQNYFELPRESIFIHTNKSIFTSEEYLWYKGYAIDRTTGRLSDDVRNIQVFLYDSKGELLNESMVLADRGMFLNQIKIDSTFAPGQYYIKAMTNYMNNFKESDAFFQKFEVIESISREEPYSVKNIEIYIQPEGQDIIYGLNSNLGLKVINDRGIPEKSVVKLLENDRVIKEIKTSDSGVAKIEFLPLEDKEYKVKVVTSSGFEKVESIDKIKANGTSLKLTEVKDHILINIENTSLGKNEDWKFIVYQEEKSFSVDVTIDNLKESFGFKKNKLFNGLNVIQLVKDGKGVKERLYYNQTNDQTNFDGNYSVEQLEKKDSLILNLNFNTQNSLMLSAYILPRENISYRSGQTIIETIRLKPYIENDDYKFLFANEAFKNFYELDVLLLMSKGRYGKNIENTKPPKLKFETENGFDQVVYLLDEITKNDQLIIGLESKFNKEVALKIDSSQVFFFKNRYPIIGEELKFSIITKDRKFKSPKIELKTDLIFNDTFPFKLNKFDTLPFKRDIRLSKNRIVSNFINVNMLDEVNIKSSSKKKKEEKLIFGTKEEVTEELYNRFFKLSVYLRTKGFLVNDNFGQFSVSNYYSRSINGSNQVAIVLDGARLTDASFLSSVLLDQFESITINKTGFGEGIFGANGVIKLETRRTALFEKDLKKSFSSYIVKKGYNEIKKFSNPSYSFYDNIVFKSLGTIAWFPNITVENSEKSSNINLKIVNTGLKDAIMYIEGISEDGQLHSYSIPLDLNKVN